MLSGLAMRDSLERFLGGPVWCVDVRGDGFVLQTAPDPSDPGGDSPLTIRGFYTHRFVRSWTADEAARKAIDEIRRDWEANYKGSVGELAISIEEVSRARRLWKPSARGYTFFTENDSSPTEHAPERSSGCLRTSTTSVTTCKKP